MTAPTRQLVLHVHTPTSLLGLATGATAPVVPLAALAHGASLTLAALVVAAGGLGVLIADLPAGRLVSQVGEQRSMVIGAVVGLVGAALCVVDASLLTLTAGVTSLGLAQAVWGLARQSYLTAAVDPARRARAISAMAGMHRLGFFVGPFAGAAVLTTASGMVGVFVIQLVAVGVAGVLMSTMADAEIHTRGTPSAPIWATARRHRAPLMRLGPGAFALGSLRATRMVLLPLWAERVGMDASTTALLFGVAGAVDVVLSYPSGVALDRWGRRGMAILSTALFGASLLAMPLVHTPTALWFVALGMGVGNGLTNGLVMTVGADISPADARPQFLSLWRLLHDGGVAGAPVAVGVIAGVAGLPPAAVAMGVVGLVGAGFFGRNLAPGRFSPDARPPSHLSVEEPPAPGILDRCEPSSSESVKPA
ncbi:MFS transporter [Gordonia westfalica]|uniref:MFS transporter n=1 Tax=Gordonia westfalica TaxID=158898 RepID=A0ABU2GR52_9ACTN|nr:MFS transporter [Gordonia westfalica]MDS1113942.1 MFS transporter [Gordonia westfalica]